MIEEKKSKQPSIDSIKYLNIENTDIVKHTLASLISVASAKTSKAYARATMKTLLQKLKNNYDIIRYISIEDVENTEDNFKAITVMSKANSFKPEEVGRVIQSLVDVYKEELGEKAGYFFIREFREILGDDYNLIIKKMGVDLRLSDMQDELYGWDKEKYQIKDDDKSNIAFIEKK